MRKLTFVAIALFAVVACTKKGDKTEKEPQGAKVVAKEPAPVTPKTVPTTSSSPEAKAAFETGMNLMLNARMTESPPHFKKAIELDGSFPQAHAMLGVVTPGPEGMVLLDKATQLGSTLPEAEQSWIAGFRLARSGDEAGAVAAWKKAAELAPDDWRVLIQLGIDANNHSDHATAKAMFDKVAQMKPDLANVHNGLAYANAGLREWDAAIAAAKKQVELLPKEPNPQDTLGEIQLMAGKLEDSEKSFQAAIALEPKFAFAWQGVALARAYRGDFKGAAEASTQRIGASEPNDKVDAGIDSALFAAAGGKPADGVAMLDAIDKDPANAKVPATAFVAMDRGFLLQQAGKYADAAKAFADAVKRTETLPGLAKTQIARRQAIGLLRNAALAGKPTADADKLVAVTATNLTSPAAKSANAYAKGLAAWAKTGAKDAVVELASCDLTFVACRYDLAVAQRKAGDAAAADATEKQLTATFVRDAGAVYFRSLIAKPTK